MSFDSKKRLAESNRALFCALPKPLKKRRATAFTELRRFLVKSTFLGLKSLFDSRHSFYVLLFDNRKHRNKAIAKLETLQFNWEQRSYKLKFMEFTCAEEMRVIWEVGVDGFFTGEEIVEALEHHVGDLHSDLTISFEVREILHFDIRTGSWAVRFNEIQPTSFKKELKVGNVTLRISKKPFRKCSFCGTDGHSIFECSSNLDKELGDTVFEGKWEPLIGNLT